MSLRPFKFPGDAQLMIDIIPKAFQYPENAAWSVQDDEIEGMEDMMKSIRRLWPLFRTLQLFVPPLRDALHGFVWEEKGIPAGLSNVSRQGGANTWIVGNVAVIPEYRRQGIARKLVAACMDLAKARGAKQIVLDVINGNLPAYKLYQDLGFQHYASKKQLDYETSTSIPPAGPLPAGYTLQTRKLGEWQPRFELAKRTTPPEVQVYEPVEEKNFKMPWLARPIIPLFVRVAGMKEVSYKVQTEDGCVVAVVGYSARKKQGGVNMLRLQIDPQHSHLAPSLIQRMVAEIQQISPGRRIEFSARSWQNDSVEAAQALGFTCRVEYHTLGMIT